MAIATETQATLLSLDRWAMIMGVNPAHFNQGQASDFMPINNRCSELWFQWSWINADSVAREDLARTINEVERDLARELGWWPAPRWIEQEVHRFPQHYRRDMYRLGGGDVRGAGVAIQTEWGKILEAGQRATTLLGTPTTAGGTLVYSDEDGDGISETATVTQATTLTDATEVKVYFQGESGEPEYEIRPARTKTIAGGTFTATFWVWQFIKPSLWETLPTTLDANVGIDITDTSNLVTSVDVYREYNDTTATSVTLYWEPRPYSEILQQEPSCCSCGGVGCVACAYTTQDGCLHVRDFDGGFVVAQAATYDSDDARWESVALSCERDPDFAKIYYYAGDQSRRWRAGRANDPLSDVWAKTIAEMATARLERPFCHCGVLTALAEKLREDLALSNAERSYSIPFSMLDNPFGTRLGEVKAWMRVKNNRDRRVSCTIA